MQTFFTTFALARHNNKYLVIKRAKGRNDEGEWNCITGYIQERESAEAGALRELKEETNLEGTIVKTSEPFWVDDNDKRWVVVASLIEVTDITNLKLDPIEVEEHRWIETEDEVIFKYPALVDVFRVLVS